MTSLSRNCLLQFLNTYSPRISGAVADFGGGGKWGEIVKGILIRGGIDDYTALDYDTGYDLLKPIKGRKFDVGITMDMLEHTSNPFLVAENITNSLKPDAILFVTVPFIWVEHEYPQDYFRFTTSGVKAIFPKLHCLECKYLADVDFPKLQLLLDKAVKDEQRTNEDITVELPLWNTRVVAVFEKVKVPAGQSNGNGPVPIATIVATPSVTRQVPIKNVDKIGMSLI